MKKLYEKPVLDTKAYAQFENVFTICSNLPGGNGCKQIINNGSGNASDNSGWIDSSSF